MKKPTDAELEEQATTLRNNGQVQGAIELYQELVRRFDKSHKAQRAAQMQHMIGVTYKVGNYTNESLQALDDALKRYEAAKDVVGMGRVLRDKGITYQYAKQLEQATEFLHQSVTTLQTAGDMAELGISEVKVGNLLREAGVLDKAEAWIDRGLETLQTTDHWFYISTAQLHKAQLRLAQHRYTEALEAVEASEQLLRYHNGEQVQKRRLAQVWYLKAAIHEATGELEMAMEAKDAGNSYANALDPASKKYLQSELA